MQVYYKKLFLLLKMRSVICIYRSFFVPLHDNMYIKQEWWLSC